MAQLDDLIQEIIEFSNLIAYSENPADPDVQNACRLFRDYLSAHLQMVRRDMIGKPTPLHTRWTAEELQQLSALIGAPATPSCEWITALFEHCLELQQSNLAAA